MNIIAHEIDIVKCLKMFMNLLSEIASICLVDLTIIYRGSALEKGWHFGHTNPLNHFENFICKLYGQRIATFLLYNMV